MIYLKNNLEEQEVWIPRQDHGDTYVTPCDRDYNDGYADGYEKGQNDGYSSGVTDGITTQKEKLASTAFTHNGVFAREDGWNEVEVNVEQTGTTCNLQEKTETIESGVIGGSWTFAPDSGYDGMSEITIVDDGYGKEQFDLGWGERGLVMVQTAITQNGVYSTPEGYSEVTVNVPQTGSSCNLQNKSVVMTAQTQTFLPDGSGYTENWVYVNSSSFDRSLPITKVRFHMNNVPSGTPRLGATEGCFSELPNKNTDGTYGGNVDQESYGYPRYHKFNMVFNGGKYVNDFTHVNTTEYNITSLNQVETGVYELDFGGTVYWSGVEGALSTPIYSVGTLIEVCVNTYHADYDGMSAITVDASGIYQSGYTSGYTDGSLTGTPDNINYIVVQSAVTISEYGTYAFVHNSGTPVSAMTIYFENGGSGHTGTTFPAYVEILGAVIEPNSYLWNPNADDSHVSVEINNTTYTGGVLYTGSSVTGTLRFIFDNNILPEGFLDGFSLRVLDNVFVEVEEIQRNALRNTSFTSLWLHQLAGADTLFKIDSGAINNNQNLTQIVVGGNNGWSGHTQVIQSNAIVENGNLARIVLNTSIPDAASLFRGSANNGVLLTDTFSNLDSNWWNYLNGKGWTYTSL